MIFDDGRKGQWKKLQEDLGFEWIEGFEELTSHDKIGSMIQSQMGSKDYEKLKQMLNNPLVSMLGNILQVYGIYGKYKDYDFVLFPGSTSTSGSSSHTSKTYYSHIGLILNIELPFDYTIKSKGFFGRLFGSGFSISNDKELNSLVTIKGDDETAIISYLNDFNKIEAIKKLYKFSKDFEVDKIGIRYKKKAKIIPQNEVFSIFEVMIEAGKMY